MLLKFREKNKYLNNEIEKEINEKGFSVYNYVSLEELLLTSRKDFLDILSKINIPFGIVSIILGLFSYYSGLLFVLPVFLFGVYFIIFNILFFKLIGRTKLFLYIADVVYTKIGLMLSDEFLYYSKDKEKINIKLEKYSNIFSEYLGKPSKLEEIISKKKKEVFDGTMKKSGGMWELIGKLGRNRESAGIAIPLIVSMFLYVVSLYLFYYIGYFFIFILSKFYLFFLKIILSFKDNIELKIKDKTLVIDEHINKMNLIYDVLNEKINNFKSGEISDIGNFVEDKFRDFYTQIDLILKEKNKLKEIIKKSQYKDFIDFNIFKKYLKNNFNKPVLDMVDLLKIYENLLNNQIKELKSLNKDSKKQELNINNTEIHDKNLETKEFILNKKLEVLKNNTDVLSKTLLR